MDRAVEAGLEEGGPAVAEAVRPSAVVLADASHSREHGLQQQTTGQTVSSVQLVWSNSALG